LQENKPLLLKVLNDMLGGDFVTVINNSMSIEFHKDSIIPKAIKKGLKVKIKHFSTFEPITRMISSIEGNKIIFEVPQKLLDSNVMIGDSVVCIFFEKEVEYVLNGEITNISLLVPQSMAIKIENVEKYTNNRKQPRFSVSLSANVKVQNTGAIYFAVVRNISIVGASFTCREALDENAEIIINVAVSKDVVITFYGRIIRKRELQNFYEYGLLQTSIDELNSEELEKYTKELEKEEDRLFAGNVEVDGISINI
jgi:hypothetical protein